MALLEMMSQNTLFSHLENRQRGELAEMAVSRNYPAGQWITYHGDIWPYLFMVESGRVDAVKESSEGRSLIVVSLEAGEVFWGLAFFIDEAFMPVGLTADKDSQIHSWSRERLLPYLTRNGYMSWELNRLMIRRMMYASDILEEIAFQPVTGRLARLLLENYGDSADDTIARDWTLDEMAARIGTKREIVCRQLSRFAEEGAIQINRTEFKITDQSLLETFARKVKG